MSCTNPVIVNIPGPRGAAGSNGTNGANGENAFSYTTASFVVPTFGASVVVPVANTSFLPESVAGQFFVSVQGCGYLQVTSVDGLLVTLQNPLAGVLGIPNAIPTTVIPIGSLITLSGAIGATGAAGASGGASSAATYIVRTPDASIPSATALSSLSSGYIKTQGSSGFGAVSTVATVPVGDISGVLPVSKGGTNLSTAPANKIPVGDGSSYLQKEIVGTFPIVVTNSAGNITLSAPSIAAFSYVTFTRRVDSGTLPSVTTVQVNQNIFSSTNYPSTNYTGIDTASGFNSVNGRFVVPYSGYYRLDALFIFTPGSTGSANAAIRKNGSTTLLPLSEAATISPVSIGPFFLQYIDQAIAGDYYELVVTAYSNSGTVGANSSFSIQRIQA
jgi:hypothetical protein